MTALAEQMIDKLLGVTEGMQSADFHDAIVAAMNSAGLPVLPGNVMQVDVKADISDVTRALEADGWRSDGFDTMYGIATHYKKRGSDRLKFWSQRGVVVIQQVR